MDKHRNKSLGEQPGLFLFKPGWVPEIQVLTM